MSAPSTKGVPMFLVVSRAAVAVGTLVVLMVVPSVAPAGADGPPNLGGGELIGRVAFDPPGLPPVNTPCRTVRFSFTADANVAFLNAAGAFWVGSLDSTTTRLTGTGSSHCENATVGGGELTINAIDVLHPTTTGALTCSPMRGAYTRTASELTAVLGGACTISGQETGRVAIVLRGYLLPAPGTGNGVTTTITSFDFRAAFTVVPA